MSLSYLTINQIKQGFKNKDFSCSELVKYYLTRSEVNQDLNAYISLNSVQSLKQAQEVDKRLKVGKKMKDLEGIPVSIKDVILTKGLKTTAASKILADYTAVYDATLVKRLKEAGVIILGKTNCDEFVMGSSNENSAFGKVLNPWNKSRVPGGSSGGSAVAVAADLCVFSVGTDTGGSIRQPAAFCGVVGLKPTYGRVSRYGLIAMTSSLDQAGPITRTAEEATQVLQVLAGKDIYDSTTTQSRVENYSQAIKKPVKGLKIGVPKEYFISGMDSEIEKKIQEAIKEMEKLGTKIKTITLPSTPFSLATYYIILTAEVSSNLARYDGIRYGWQSRVTHSLADVYQKSRAEGFGPEVKRRIMMGTYVLSEGYKEAYYRKALKVKQLIKNEYQKAFKEVDVLITPTTPTVAFKIGEKFTDPLTMYLSDIYTVAANIAGICGISLGCGFSKQKLPIGLQIMGAPFNEATILKLAYHYQQHTNFHQQHPKI
ncbi:Asp-tRNA(Asn)/Glu-tRNA(Gln) amidotransferase subunit GatA [Patescibacteria group bacterium]|nr:Asp-tRNA(Asn)/Glu-tRNA(Gln) amidotransferase subunit GatA [Patescibacteria group bacterium]